jgi:hypothetical protein
MIGSNHQIRPTTYDQRLSIIHAGWLRPRSTVSDELVVPDKRNSMAAALPTADLGRSCRQAQVAFRAMDSAVATGVITGYSRSGGVVVGDALDGPAQHARTGKQHQLSGTNWSLRWERCAYGSSRRRGRGNGLTGQDQARPGCVRADGERSEAAVY